MANIKVKPLEFYMQRTHEELTQDGYVEMPSDFPKLNREGYYCVFNNTWFEYNNKAYAAYPTLGKARAKQQFLYDLIINDEKILPEREVAAIKQVLKTTRNSEVKKTLHKVLYEHNCSKSHRDGYRESCLYMNKFMKSIRSNKCKLNV